MKLPNCRQCNRNKNDQSHFIDVNEVSCIPSMTPIQATEISRFSSTKLSKCFLGDSHSVDDLEESLKFASVKQYKYYINL